MAKRKSLLESLVDDSLNFLKELKTKENKFYELFSERLSDNKNNCSGTEENYTNLSFFPVKRAKRQTKKDCNSSTLEILVSSFSKSFFGSDNETAKMEAYHILAIYGVDTDSIVATVEQNLSSNSSLFYPNIENLLRDTLSDFFFNYELAILSYHVDKKIYDGESKSKGFFVKLKDAVSKKLKSQGDSSSVESWEDVVNAIVGIAYSAYFHLTRDKINF